MVVQVKGVATCNVRPTSPTDGQKVRVVNENRETLKKKKFEKRVVSCVIVKDG